MRRVNYVRVYVWLTLNWKLTGTWHVCVFANMTSFQEDVTFCPGIPGGKWVGGDNFELSWLVYSHLAVNSSSYDDFWNRLRIMESIFHDHTALSTVDIELLVVVFLDLAKISKILFFPKFYPNIMKWLFWLYFKFMLDLEKLAVTDIIFNFRHLE